MCSRLNYSGVDKLKKIVVLVISILFLANLYTVTVVDSQPIILGERVTIHSGILNEDRSLLIYLPSSYDESEAKYPVLFQVEGSELLFHSESGTIRYLSEFKDKIPALIVVNILFTNYRRDIFPIAVPQIPGTGGSDNFILFLSEELIPFLEKNYRISDFKMIYGQSNTGMFAIYSMLSQPQLFNACIAASPAVGQADNFMYSLADSLLEVNRFDGQTIFFTHALDDPLTRIVGDALPGFLQILKNKAPAELNWQYQEYETGGHCPYRSLEDGLLFTMNDWIIPDGVIDSGLPGISDYFDDLLQKYGITPDFVSLLKHTAMDLMREEKYDRAYEFFQELRKIVPEEMLYAYQIGKIAALNGTYFTEGIANLRAYVLQEKDNINPSRSAACWRMGQIYEQNGDSDKARESYLEGLGWDENDPNCKEALEKLTQE